MQGHTCVVTEKASADIHGYVYMYYSVYRVICFCLFGYLPIYMRIYMLMC